MHTSLTAQSMRRYASQGMFAVGRCCLAPLAVLIVLTATGRALAGFSIEISVDGGPTVVYLDNSPDDLNKAPYDMQIDFQVGDVGKNWEGKGTVLATGGGIDAMPPVATIVTDTLIENIGGQFLSGEIKVVHNYAASGLFAHTATLDGQFENVLGNEIGFADLKFFAAVNGQSLGTLIEGPATGLPIVQPFVGGTLGPLLLPTTTEHEIKLQFYLGDPGDAIRMFNSAEIHTAVPEPSGVRAGLLGAAMILAWRVRLRSRPRAPASS
ncbi:MAG: hypothetical protein AB7U73_20790 [Pirellulales bacterium]